MGKRPNCGKQLNRFDWLKQHPEDQWIDDENQQARKTGYHDDDVKRLMVAICAQACTDYKKASLGLKITGENHHDHHKAESIIYGCRQFFKDDMFQHFVNRMPVEEIEARIRETPLTTINLCSVQDQEGELQHEEIEDETQWIRKKRKAYYRGAV